MKSSKIGRTRNGARRMRRVLTLARSATLTVERHPLQRANIDTFEAPNVPGGAGGTNQSR
jgi:hypothetical protein